MRLPILIAIAISVPLAAGVPASPAAALPVFDAANYAQNLVQAARALEQVNNQLRSLQNEATMVEAMARKLKRIDFPQLDRLTNAMQRIDALMDEARDLDFRADRLDERVRALFPGEVANGLARDARVAAARARLEAASGAYRQAMAVQARVVENVREDSAFLAELAGRSQGAEGGLQAQQAANQLLALSIKQQLQLQQLAAAEYRSQAIERARRAQAEAEGQAATRRFLGSGRAYSPPGN
jgi:P-type conjugative transfer protein TrbJ